MCCIGVQVVVAQVGMLLLSKRSMEKRRMKDDDQDRWPPMNWKETRDNSKYPPPPCQARGVTKVKLETDFWIKRGKSLEIIGSHRQQETHQFWCDGFFFFCCIFSINRHNSSLLRIILQYLIFWIQRLKLEQWVISSKLWYTNWADFFTITLLFADFELCEIIASFWILSFSFAISSVQPPINYQLKSIKINSNIQHVRVSLSNQQEIHW